MDADAITMIMNNKDVVMLNLALLFLLKIVCFVIGFLIVRIGAELLREGVKGEFKFGGSAGNGNVNLTSASPGLLFLLLGVILISYAMWVDKDITLNYVATSLKNQQSISETLEKLPIPSQEEITHE